LAAPLDLYEAGAPQLLDVIGHGGSGQAEILAQIAHAAAQPLDACFTTPLGMAERGELEENAQPLRVGQSLEDSGETIHVVFSIFRHTSKYTAGKHYVKWGIQEHSRCVPICFRLSVRPAKLIPENAEYVPAEIDAGRTT
jgi:hypothetical protein